MGEAFDPLVGRIVGGRYRVVRPIAAGGMGAVYDAVQEALRRDVAVKVVRPGLVDAAFRRRFETEAIATSRLRDPHVVTVHDFGIDDELGLPFLVFEKLDGRDLQSEIDARGAMEWRRAVRVLQGITSALVAAHRVGIVHRDLKPSNVFLVDTSTGGELVKVIDFGIAKILSAPESETQEGVISGSPGFIAPERFVGAGDDTRSDLYALGAIAFEMLAGRPLFVEKTPLALAIRHMHDDAPRLRDVDVRVPPRLDQLVGSLLQKTAARRPQSADDVLRELDRIAALAMDAATDFSHDKPTSGSQPPLVSAAADAAGAADRAEAAAHQSRAAELVEGATLGRYVLERELGKGGMGVVWRAHDQKLGRRVALKVLPPAFAAHPERLRRFRREGKAAASLTHPCIATVLDVDEHNGVAFIAMELVEGRTLRALLRQERKLDRARALAIARDVAGGLACAHAAGIVHRDVKPENVMVTDEGRAKLLDFGIAHLRGEAPLLARGAGGADPDATQTQTDAQRPTQSATREPGALTAHGAFVGTPAYVSPEQAEGALVDARSDIFSFGAVLHEMLSGAPAFTGASTASILAAVLKDEPRPVRAGHLSPVVRRCLAKDPARRFADGAALLAAVESAARPTLPSAAIAGGVVMVALVAIAVAGAVAFGGVGAAPRSDRSTLPVAGSVTRLTEAPGVERDAALSPDGTRIAYAAAVGSGNDVFVMQASGASERVSARAVNLTNTPDRSERSPAFSPNGQLIAFVEERASGDAIWLVDESVGAPRGARLLVEGGASPSFTADGRSILYATEAFDQPEAVTLRGHSTIRSVDIVTGKSRTLHEDHDCFAPVASRDGHVAFWCIADGKRDVFVLPRGATAARRVTHDEAVDFNPMWSARGDTLYFLSDRSGTMTLWSVPFDDDDGSDNKHNNEDNSEDNSDNNNNNNGKRVAPTAVFGGATAMRSASIAAERVVYRTDTTMSAIERRSFDVGLARAGPATRVLELGRTLRGIDVSPDGRWLVVESFGQHNDLLLVAADGSDWHALTDDAHFDRGARFLPGTSPSRIVFASNRGGRYGLFTLESGAAKQAGAPRAWPAARCPVVAPVPSLDGQRVAAALLDCGNHIAIFDVNADGGVATHREIALPAGATALPMAWLDERTVVALRPREGLVRIDIEGGAVVERAASLGAVEHLPDGRLLAFEGRRIVVLDRDATAARDAAVAPILELPPTVNEASFAMSSDGATLWMTTVRTESDVWIATLP